MDIPLLAQIALPYARLELPGWGQVLRVVGVYDDKRWRAAPVRSIRGKLHGYVMHLSLAEWTQRETYFVARSTELEVQTFMMACLRPGDTFVELRGDIGMSTLLAARMVGSGGRVHTFEATEGERIARSLEENGIRNVTLHRMGLANFPAKLTPNIAANHSGEGTLAAVEGEDAKLVKEGSAVTLFRGDDELTDELPGAVMIKADFGGFEVHAIRGLAVTLKKYRPVMVTELWAHHLKRRGSSVREVFDLMQGLGYRAYSLGLRWRPLRRRLSLRLITDMDEKSLKVGWVLPDSDHESRLAPFIGR